MYLFNHKKELRLNLEEVAGFGYSSGSTLWLQLYQLLHAEMFNISHLFLYSPQVGFGIDFPADNMFSNEPYFKKNVILPLANDYFRLLEKFELLDQPVISPLSAKRPIPIKIDIFTAPGDYNQKSLIKYSELQSNVRLHTVHQAQGGHLALWADKCVLHEMSECIATSFTLNNQTQSDKSPTAKL